MAAQNPLRRAYIDAAESTRRIGELFAKLGGRQNPNTPILESYRLANYALREVVRRKDRRGLKTITSELRSSVRQAVTPLLEQAMQDGAASAYRQLGYYGRQPKKVSLDRGRIEAVYDVVEAKINEQEAAALAMLLGDAEPNLILGDNNRSGVLRPFDPIVASAFWLAQLFWECFFVQVSMAKGGGFEKQVVAALDHRTTETCLLAHGQIVALHDKFHLTGTPRFADYMQWTPFHYYCRSSIVLYLPGYDDGLTAKMVESARVVLEEREQGINKKRHPVNAFV